MEQYNKAGYCLGIDIGGSHFAMGIVDTGNMLLLQHTLRNVPVNSKGSAQKVLGQLLEAIRQCITDFGAPVSGIGLSVPGPFDYRNGIFKIQGLDKYDALFGVDLKQFLSHELKTLLEAEEAIAFTNDADSFALGEVHANQWIREKAIGVTLGTGVGSGFVAQGELAGEDDTVPPGGNIYNLPFKGGMVEDMISTRWLLNRSGTVLGSRVASVKELAEEAKSSQKARDLFEAYGQSLGEVLAGISGDFGPDVLILGGGISKSYPLFKDALETCFTKKPKIHIAQSTANAAIIGAVLPLINKRNTLREKRNSKQEIMPIEAQKATEEMGYTLYPSFEIGYGTIGKGMDGLVEKLPRKGNLIIDGYMGAYWDDFLTMLTSELRQNQVEVIVRSVGAAYKEVDQINTMLAPYLGGLDPVFGKIYPGQLSDFFDAEKLKALVPEKGVLNILYGPGAALAGWEGPLVYIDMPKNEIQFRARAQQVHNLGGVLVKDKKQQYKRMYFIDWPMLNKHKNGLLPKLDIVVDGQFGNEIAWTNGETLRQALKDMGSHAFRPRPWFEPGIWGGDWMKNRFGELPKDVPNYAWSFELIAPENGIVISKDGMRLEVSFDILLFQDNKAILGDAAAIFGTEFPIRRGCGP